MRICIENDWKSLDLINDIEKFLSWRSALQSSYHIVLTITKCMHHKLTSAVNQPHLTVQKKMKTPLPWKFFSWAHKLTFKSSVRSSYNDSLKNTNFFPIKITVLHSIVWYPVLKTFFKILKTAKNIPSNKYIFHILRVNKSLKCIS